MEPQNNVLAVHSSPVLTVHASGGSIERMVQSQDLRDEFASRLKKALAHNGLPAHGSGVHLCNLTKVTAKAASKWLNGESMPGAAKMKAISDGLGVRLEWLQYGVGPMTTQISVLNGDSNVAPAPKMEGYVPVISWVQAGAWTEVCNVDFMSEEIVPRPPACSDSTFALRVKGQSMAPRYEPGLIIYVDPEVVPFDGDDVVAMLTDDNEATFKQYVEEPGGKKMLKARNPGWPEPWVPINGNCQIIGVVIATMWLRTPRAG